MSSSPYLKQLELKGFKSFADRTVVEFFPGINVIIGPNGCGKSNLVDAIHWIFGTHTARDLRGMAQDDLIFGGTDKRAPSGFAEVKGIFASESGFPHPDFSSAGEVEIYRRWNRGEHSEFRINHVRVRWRDLMDFLYALGWGSYSVIHQDSIQEISLATPAECRHFLEESSGISRFYIRREEALRRITETRKNLEEVLRVITSMEERHGGLKLQAEIAQRVIFLKDEEKRLALLLFSLDRAQKEKELNALLQEGEGLSHSLAQKHKELEETYTAFQSLSAEEERDGRRRGELKEVEKEKNALREKQMSGASELNREEEIGREEIASLTRALADAQNELEVAVRSRKKWEETLKDLTERQKGLEGELSTLKVQRRKWAEEEEKREKARHALREEIVEILRDEAYLQSEVEGFRLRLRELRSLKERRERSSLTLEEEVKNLKAQMAVSLEKEKEESQSLSHLKEMRLALEKEIEEGKERVSALEEREKELRSTREELERERSQLLHNLKKLFPFPGKEEEYLFAWDGIEPPDSQADLWDTILGERLRVLKPRDPRFLQDLARKAHTLAQRITLFCEESFPSPSASHSSSQTRYIPLDTHLSFSPEYEWARLLLKGIYLSPEPLSPPAIPPDLPGDLEELWDLEGVAYIPGRGFSLGPLERTGVSHIKFQLAGIEEKREHLEASLKEVLQEIVEEKGKMAEREERFRHLMDEESRKESELKELVNLKRKIEVEMARRMEELDSIGDELKSLADEEEEWAEEMRMKELVLEEKEKKRKAREEEFHRITQELNEERQRGEEIASKEAELRQRLDAILKEVREVSQGLREEEFRMTTLARKIQEGNDRLRHWEERIRKLEEERRKLMEEQRTLEEELKAITRELEEIEARSLERHKQRKSLEGHLVSCQREIERLSTLKAKTDEKISMLRERLLEAERVFREVYGEEPTVSPLKEQVSREEIEEEITKIRREVQAIGPVNYQAIEEVERVSHELNRLKEERGDLEEALERAEKLLEEMEKEARTRFLSFLEAVNQEFYRLFEELSGGGKGQLLLEDPDKIWESGVVISVQFPGSRRSRMELLSGGQKALTSLALLCALFMIRPGPCLVLDEVDAPLDEVNLKRFHGLISKLSLRTQIILVTHHPLTMEIAQRIIGVTQRERGVSTLISYHLA